VLDKQFYTFDRRKQKRSGGYARMLLQYNTYLSGRPTNAIGEHVGRAKQLVRVRRALRKPLSLQTPPASIVTAGRSSTCSTYCKRQPQKRRGEIGKAALCLAATNWCRSDELAFALAEEFQEFSGHVRFREEVLAKLSLCAAIGNNRVLSLPKNKKVLQFKRNGLIDLLRRRQEAHFGVLKKIGWGFAWTSLAPTSVSLRTTSKRPPTSSNRARRNSTFDFSL
jgi:hypothetical protein